MRDSSIAVAVRAWEASVPAAIRGDTLWRMEAYRLGLYVCDVAWNDMTLLSKDIRTRSLADQLHRSLGSISANIAEGYSRGGGRDRARFLEYALGSTREARGWYFKGRRVLETERMESQIDILTSVTRLLLVMTKDQRSVHLREPDVSYSPSSSPDAPAGSAGPPA